MEDFISKKNKLADMLETYIENKDSEADLVGYVQELIEDIDFKTKDLFNNLLNELKNYLPELSRKELKQRVLIIRSFIE